MYPRPPTYRSPLAPYAWSRPHMDDYIHDDAVHDDAIHDAVGAVPKPKAVRVRSENSKAELSVRMDTPRTTSVAGGGNLSAHEAEMAEKSRKAMEMRAAGATYAQIAKRLGYAGPGPVYQLVKRSLARIQVEGVAEMRLVQLDRLHTMLMAVWPKVVDPTHPQALQAVDRALAITDRITRIYGIEGSPETSTEAGVTISNSITVGGSMAEVMAAMQAMTDARNAASETILEAEVEDPTPSE